MIAGKSFGNEIARQEFLRDSGKGYGKPGAGQPQPGGQAEPPGRDNSPSLIIRVRIRSKDS